MGREANAYTMTALLMEHIDRHGIDRASISSVEVGSGVTISLSGKRALSALKQWADTVANVEIHIDMNRHVQGRLDARLHGHVGHMYVTVTCWLDNADAAAVKAAASHALLDAVLARAAA